MKSLVPLELDLRGQILIEASAGTGKTYTIALLFLRLLLEHDLSVSEILVVTFTNAAAEELRGRIRQRIRDALNLLEGRARAEDPLLQELLAKNAGQEAAILLADALTCMDEAAIYTIHGFCQRMLQEHAFESGSPFEMELLEREHLLRARIMEDFWRQRLYPLPPSQTAWAASLWQSPSDLLGKLGGHLDRAEVDCIPAASQQELDRWTEKLHLLFVQVRMQWPKCGAKIGEMLRTSPRLLRDKSKGYGQDRLDAALNAMELMAGLEDVPWLLAEHLELLSISCIRAALNKKKGDPPEHPFFELFEQFVQTHRSTMNFRRISVLLEARTYLASELERRKKEAGQISFDDLLTKLDAGLQTSDDRLAQCMGRRFPVIMVDEFQDTDPIQYRIFKKIHETSKKEQACRPTNGLFLIGDPKQAIYSFRGADIFTYIQARQDTPEPNRLTMTVNHRSSRSMVKAVSRLFARDAPFFLPKSKIDFPEVVAKGHQQDEQPFLVDGCRPAALTCLLLQEEDKPLAKSTAEEQSAQACAHEIASLLAAGGAGRARIGERELSAGDVAVLVRTHAEADLMRRKLNALGIASVCGGQDSVFSSREARQLLLFMTSLCKLSDSGMLRTVLAGDLFGWTAEQLERLQVDGQKWDQAWAAMDRCRQLWQQQGFLPMFQRLLAEQQTVGRLSAAPSGERMLTNYLHLAELLQEAGQQLDSPDALLRWLASQIQSPEEQSESQQLRLESDENLVKIVTIHKAKGMEYPLVFLPFPWNGRPCANDEPLIFHQPESPERLCVDLGSGNKAHLLLAEQERMSEDLRLLYVAATRAVHCFCFCWGWIKRMEDSALCYLLHDVPPCSSSQIAEDLQKMADVLEVKSPPEECFWPSLQSASRTPLLRPATFGGRINASWQLVSYSSLAARRAEVVEQPGHDDGDAEERVAAEAEPSHDAFGFPKGAMAGSCLHDILERISFGNSLGHEKAVKEALNQASIDEEWGPVVCRWMQDVLNTPLLGRDGLFSLSCLREDEQVKEMSFDFPLAGLRMEAFNRLLSEHGHAPLLGAGEILHGMMTGFVDLVFCRQGRYYVSDYKSNHLGCRVADYEPKKLEAAMAEHRYDLQYLIYTLALHRFLAGRIRSYSYESHFGGVFYFFLRGMGPDKPGSGVFFARPSLALVEGMDKCCGDQGAR